MSTTKDCLRLQVTKRIKTLRYVWRRILGPLNFLSCSLLFFLFLPLLFFLLLLFLFRLGLFRVADGAGLVDFAISHEARLVRNAVNDAHGVVTIGIKAGLILEAVFGVNLLMTGVRRRLLASLILPRFGGTH
ncbi:hypothetical protein F4820DRAFT_463664, partial [Hypoxylon rubiginosum]